MLQKRKQLAHRCMSHHPARHLAQGKIDIKKASQVLQGQLSPARLIEETWHHFLHRLHQIELCGLPSRLFGKHQPYLDGMVCIKEIPFTESIPMADPFQEAKEIALTDIVIPHHIVHLSVKLKDDMAEGAVVINGHG